MKAVKINISITVFFLVTLIPLPQGFLYSSPYRLSPATDGILSGSGLVLFGVSLYAGKKTEPLTDKEIAELSKNDINSFDRSAADNWSPEADKWSDRVLAPLVVSPLAFLAESETRNDFIIVGIMYTESVLITNGLCGIVKNSVQRERPFTYNADAPYSTKKEKDAVLSFYSGHTANAFNSAVFVSTVFSDYYPDSLWHYAIWATTISAASLTGYLRYRAGMHYPSDIITSAAVGCVTGWLIPVMHRFGNENLYLQIITGEDNKIVFSLSF